MNSFLDSGEHLERELTPEPIAAPAAGRVLHLRWRAPAFLRLDAGAVPSQPVGHRRERAGRCR